MPDDRQLNGTEPIGQDEIVFRRVLKSQYKPDKDQLSAKGFNPRPSDTTGISLCRANYLPDPKPEAAAALGRAGMEFWVVELRAADLRSAGMEVKPEPSQEFIGHASIPILNAASVDTSDTKILTDSASRLPRTIHGPFTGKALA